MKRYLILLVLCLTASTAAWADEFEIEQLKRIIAVQQAQMHVEFENALRARDNVAWQPVEVKSMGAPVVQSSNLKCRVKDGVVELMGLLKFFPQGDNVFGSLPEACRPSETTPVLIQLNERATFYKEVQFFANGTFRFMEQYSPGNYYATFDGVKFVK